MAEKGEQSEQIWELLQALPVERQALDIKDDIMLALVKYKQAKDRYETENKEQEI